MLTIADVLNSKNQALPVIEEHTITLKHRVFHLGKDIQFPIDLDEVELALDIAENPQIAAEHLEAATIERSEIIVQLMLAGF